MPVDFHSDRRVRVKTGVVFGERSDMFHVKHQPLSFSNRAICSIKFASSTGVTPAVPRETFEAKCKPWSRPKSSFHVKHHLEASVITALRPSFRGF